MGSCVRVGPDDMEPSPGVMTGRLRKRKARTGGASQTRNPRSRRGGRYVRYFGKALKVAWLKLRERLTMKTQRLSYRGYEIQITHTLVMWRAAIYHSSYLRAVDWTLVPIIAADAGIAEIQAQQRIDSVLDAQPPEP